MATVSKEPLGLQLLGRHIDPTLSKRQPESLIGSLARRRSRLHNPVAVTRSVPLAIRLSSTAAL
jgi:hypothetical protein